MPFWWRRRRKRWYGKQFRWRRRKAFYKPKRKYRRRKYRRPLRRRRRKLRKVRRKKKAIVVKQWQPDSVTKCKIIGQSAIVVGAEGKQMWCYTVNKTIGVPPKTPYGGGFGVEQFSLKYLYEEYTFHNNIWTKSNVLKDLCRYIFCKITFFRDPKTDFCVAYDRQLPFQLTKYTYPGTHPQQLMLTKRHKLILSKLTKQNSKLTKTFKIKPPKQMLSKWFFAKPFSKYPLLNLKAAATDLRHSYLGCCNENPQIFFHYLNHGFYTNTNWGAVQTGPYLPFGPTVPTTITYKYKNENISIQKPTVATQSKDPYSQSIDYDTGYFQWKFLQTQCWDSHNPPKTCSANNPIAYAIYNPTKDSGYGNSIYLVSTLSNSWDQPPKDSAILIQGMPLWLGLYGYLDYVRQIKADKTWLESHVVVLKSPAIFTYPNVGADGWYCPLSRSFIDGKGPFNQPPTSSEKIKWFPQIRHQHEVLNAFVESGPFIPKYSNQTESNWELKYKYTFHFKWGGPQLHEPEIANPATQDQYDVPDTFKETIQIENPERLDPRSILHDWDYRRGFIKERSLKRMSNYLSTPSDIQEPQEPPKKKERIGPQLTVPQQKEEETLSCLLSLCKENICQESQEDQDIKQLIYNQQLQQQQLKRDILQLIHKMKQEQQLLQLHTGLLP
nr:MAG: ORF1 [Torque teno midi virus]